MSLKTQYYTASSLDGFIAAPGHSLEWLLQLDASETSYPEFIRDVGAIAMGSHTYEWILRHVTEGWAYEQPAWVFTTRDLPPIPGADIRFVRGDVRTAHEHMAAAAGGKNIWIVGAGDLAGQFYDQGLLDELIIQIAPVTLGRGFPVFPREAATPPLRLVSARTYAPFVEVRYEVQKR